MLGIAELAPLLVMAGIFLVILLAVFFFLLRRDDVGR